MACTRNVLSNTNRDEIVARKVSDPRYEIVPVGDGNFEIRKDGKKAYFATENFCECSGFFYRASCKHTRWIQELVKNDRDAERISREVAEMVVDRYISKLKDLVGDFKWEVCGSFRRKKAVVRDIDLLVEDTGNGERILSAAADALDEVEAHGGKQVRGWIWVPEIDRKLQIDIHICPPNEWFAHVLYFTGSKTFGRMMRARAKAKGWKLNEKFLELENGRKIFFTSEEEPFAWIGMKYVAPEDRG
jgi:DNA polymerase/3'-5' exonuclease PolX